MKNEKKELLRLLGFCAVILVLTLALNALLKPKWSEGYGSGTVIRGFYKMPKDSVDVLILGSSNVICGVDANTMLEEYGISAYSCGTEAQPMFGSYAWLCEGMRRQSIKAVVLDMGSIFDRYDEPGYRKVFDYMRPSALKLRLLAEYKRDIAPDADISSYILPLILYHSRFSELTREDISFRRDSLRGFYPRSEIRNKDFDGIGTETSAECKEIPEADLASFYKLAEKCRERDIPLIHISCASVKFTAEKHNAVKKLADENGLVFLDFNETDKWPEIDYADDMADFEHFNLFGAKKVTRVISDTLLELVSLPDRSGDTGAQAHNRAAYAVEGNGGTK